VKFTDCNFGASTSYAMFRPYSVTTLTNCKFSEDFTFSVVAELNAGNIVMDNCYVGDTRITSENISKLFKIEGDVSKITFK
jgi:hypothetical protein